MWPSRGSRTARLVSRLGAIHCSSEGFAVPKCAEFWRTPPFPGTPTGLRRRQYSYNQCPINFFHTRYAKVDNGRGLHIRFGNRGASHHKRATLSKSGGHHRNRNLYRLWLPRVPPPEARTGIVWLVYGSITGLRVLSHSLRAVLTEQWEQNNNTALSLSCPCAVNRSTGAWCARACCYRACSRCSSCASK